MRVKTFETATMQEALDAIKREMGDEAFILSTRTRRRAGPSGAEASFIEVTAAVDATAGHVSAGRAAAAEPEARSLPATGTYGLRPALARPPAEAPAAVETRPVPRPGGRTEPPPPPMDLQPIRRELLEIKGAVEALRDREQRNAEILQELDQLKSMLSRLQRQGLPAAHLQLPACLLELYSDLIGNDLEPMIAMRLCEYTQRALVEHGGEQSLDGERARLYMRRVIADFIPVANPIQLDPGRTRVAALVGPTGVGKTTTIAKLASYAKLQLGQKVALLTLDTFRLAAVDQLQQYAQILQVPLHVALTVEDMRNALRFYQDRALVLIDTPGHSPKDAETLGQLKGLLDELPDVETHLVLSATTKPRDLVDTVQRFEGLAAGRIIFTKLDETSTYGPMLSTLVRIKRPLSYLGTGQEVPDDLELATSRRVADLILPPPVNPLERSHD